MASKQDQFYKNYRFERVPNRSGKGYRRKCIYIGDHYTWKLPKKEISSNRILFGISELATLLVFFSAGAVRNKLNLTLYIAVPAMLGIVTLIFEIFAMWTFCFARMPYREDDYRRMDRTFQVTFLSRAVVLVLASVLGYVDTFRFQLGIWGVSISTGYLFCSLTAFLLYRKYQKIRASGTVLPKKR